MERCRPLADTTHQQQAMERSSMLHRLANRASRYSTNLSGDIRRTLGRYPPVVGGTAAVHHGTWISRGTEVAVKTFRNTPSESEEDLKRLFREMHTWSKLRHENIVPMLGISTEFDSTISIISEWMPLGNAHDYVKDTDHDPRPLLEDVASGLYYLHSHELGPVVHGCLKGSDVLVSSDRRALLTDFGFSTLNISTFSMTADAKCGIALRWAPPELLDDGVASTASDVWAFGMTALELFTRAVPFSDCHTVGGVIAKLMNGRLPPHPTEEAAQFRLTDAWWEICLSCWEHDPSSRPVMKDIAEKIQATMCSTGATSLPRRTPPAKQDCYFPDPTHQQPVMELSSVLQELCNWASTCGIDLNGRISRNLGRSPLRGSTALVHQGTLAPDGTIVAIKAFHCTLSGTEAELKHIFREVHLCSKLYHENVTRLLGISTEFDSTVSIIYEWMPLGNAYTYVQNTQNDPRPLLRDIANGLYYLHSHELGPIVHGDLKGVNVLVSSDRRALLSDFGLSTLNISTLSMTVDASRGGTPHWMAPELLDECPVSVESDVWAFGMTILELFTREPPFRDCRRETVFYRLMQGNYHLDLLKIRHGLA
ncbi:kinase-like domain-containing protein [Pisolithus sp. B1]|nr:kinase-like domain-containing protein [Pisolithus sp. B1]